MQTYGQETTPETEGKFYEIKVIGAGNDGSLSIKPSDLDFSTVTVGFNKTLKLCVFNKSKTNIYIDFNLQQKDMENASDEENDRVNQIVNSCF